MTKVVQHALICLLVATCIVFLFVGVSFRQSQELKDLWNVGHFILFLFIAYPAIIHNRLNQYSLSKRILLITLVTIAFAGGVEFIQVFLSREVSIIDIYISICGSITSVFLFTQVSGAKRWIGSIVFTIAGTIFFLYTAAVFVHSKIEYPITIGISKAQESSYVSGKAIRHYNEITEEITVTFNTDVYSTIKFTNIINDWSNYKYLRVDLSNLEDRPFRLRFRVNDQQHIDKDSDYRDRYSSRLHINPGRQDVIIKINTIKNAPFNRTMNMQDIQQLQIFTRYAAQSFKTIIHSITLE